MKIIRWVLGRIILLLNFILAPKKLKRDAALQQKIDQETKHLQLYQFAACPFCVKVRRTMRKNALDIKLVDAKQPANRALLIEQGGKGTVPCLRIEEDNKITWMYESSDIITYLEKRFA
ncbi:MAG: glutathione S-transferase N-terminal domain-containing protein [Psychromonas sp.]|uniref:glutathione S-transferase N-terminal domain-containing protein n=1 Tax=Psychromonas arctica TaxID=168275 RepID=UPI002FD6C4A1